MNSILSYAKKETTPSKKLQQKKQRVAKIACDLVSQCIEKHAQVVGFELGGSYAKGTWLPGKADIDIFVKFNKKTSEKDFRNIGTNDGVNELEKLAEMIRSKLSQLGFSPDKKFKPHVTIFRVKNKIEDLSSKLDKFSSCYFGKQTVSEIKLKKSELTPNGPIYTDLLVVKGKQ